MKMSRFSTATRVVTAFMLLALLVSGQSLANTTNSVPKVFSFETYADGTDLIGTNGWYGEAGAIMVVVTNDTFSGPKPLPLEPHSRIAKITASVTNLFDGDTGETNVWMDLCIQPRQWQQPDPPDANTIPPDAQAVLYVDTNGYLNALCSVYDGGIPGYTNRWAQFTQLAFETNEWLRLTMEMRYNANFIGQAFYQVTINSTDVLTNEYGRTAIDVNDTGGSWFLCVKRDAAAFNAVTFSGNSQIDDLVITNGAPTPVTLRTIKVIADTGSTFSPAGPNVLVVDGEDKTFIITTDTVQGYELTNLWWGVGQSEAGATNPIAITNVLSMKYTFSNVTNDFTIKSEAWQPGWQGTHTDNGTLIQWLRDYGLTDYPTAAEAEAGNDDTDVVPNWKEYVAGTDPTDGTSYFRILGQGHGSPSNYISYYITTNSGITTAVDIYRSTNLMNDAGGWGIVDTISRDYNGANGTSTWWDIDVPSNVPAFYRPVVEWDPAP